MVQVEAVIVDQRGPVDGCDEKFIDFCGACEAVDRAAAELEVACDSAKAVTAFDAFVDQLVAFASAGDQRPRPSVDVQLCPVVAFMGWAVFDAVVVGSEGLSRVSAIPPNDAFDCLRQVVQKVPCIGYLSGLRSAGLGPVAEGSGPVAADDPDLRVIPQPGREGTRGPVGQDIDRAAGCHVDEDRRVGASPSNGELVDAEMRHQSR
ncbi:hypothetical protein NBG84_14415 [Streptomyces sp. CWNU-1]|uniref:Uncharacterized protein n=1 Tax=Streptomyces albipurpureus TaxID=2897419 RepID=A0ABT0ULI2_9ACTN|nr:hypothetical protein [Streptomyces sp. CWNU-1]MCM2389472.1 hypothetical protein [Streptomyces sp. CWNU-1]